jgi:hypothetical protein
MTFAASLQSIRLMHRYLGLFFAPTILLFAITGGLQMFGLHETARGSSYAPLKIIVHLSQLHKKGTLYLPAERLLHPIRQSLMGQSWMVRNLRLQSRRKPRRHPTRFP